jgi:aspartate kinase
MSMDHARRAPLVLKFGGTSVRDADAMRRVVTIVEGELRATASPDTRIVVVTSACSGVTDTLLECARLCAAERPDDALALAGALRERHFDILGELDPEGSLPERGIALAAMLDEIERLVRGVVLLGELTPRTVDLFASYGERLSSILLTTAFIIAGTNAELADSRSFIITDETHIDARPLMREIDRRAPEILLPLLDDHEVVVAQGFIGSTTEGITTTIGRGGSDHTCALLGAALGSPEIQIWTDVSGILTADPRVVPAATVVPVLTFTEARELAYFGAKVIHPDTIIPAVEREIPVVIKNSMRPVDAGTRILPDSSPVPAGVHSITMKKGMTILRLAPRDPREGSGPVERALSLFAEHGVTLLCGLFAESRGVAVVPSSEFNDFLLAALEASCLVDIDREMAILCLTGSGLCETPETLSEPLAALEGNHSAFIAAGTSQHLMLIGVSEPDALGALRAMHERLFERRGVVVGR